MTAAPVADRRRPPAGVVAWAAVLVLLVSVAFALGAARVRGGDDTEVRGVTIEAVGAKGSGKVTGAPPKTFGIAGGVSGLYPGVGATLSLTISNPNAQPIDVESVDVSVGAGVPGCPGTDISVGRFRGSERVAARGTATIALPIEMLGSALDTCKGASFPLTFSGRAVQVTGSNR